MRNYNWYAINITDSRKNDKTALKEIRRLVAFSDFKEEVAEIKMSTYVETVISDDKERKIVRKRLPRYIFVKTSSPEKLSDKMNSVYTHASILRENGRFCPLSDSGFLEEDSESSAA